jgi:hypothetical protein
MGCGSFTPAWGVPFPIPVVLPLASIAIVFLGFFARTAYLIGLKGSLELVKSRITQQVDVEFTEG